MDTWTNKYSDWTGDKLVRFLYLLHRLTKTVQDSRSGRCNVHLEVREGGRE